MMEERRSDLGKREQAEILIGLQEIIEDSKKNSIGIKSDISLGSIIVAAVSIIGSGAMFYSTINTNFATMNNQIEAIMKHRDEYTKERKELDKRLDDMEDKIDENKRLHENFVSTSANTHRKINADIRKLKKAEK